MDADVATIVVVIPTLNEEQSIGGVVGRIPRQSVSPRHRGGWRQSRRHGDARQGRQGAEVIDAGRGYGRACLAATQAAEGADILVFMDGDGADDPQAIARLVEPIRAGHFDFVIGSRARGNREPESIAGISLRPGSWPVGACGCSMACPTPTCAPSAPSVATLCWRSVCAS